MPRAGVEPGGAERPALLPPGGVRPLPVGGVVPPNGERPGSAEPRPGVDAGEDGKERDPVAGAGDDVRAGTTPDGEPTEPGAGRPIGGSPDGRAAAGGCEARGGNADVAARTGGGIADGRCGGGADALDPPAGRIAGGGPLAREPGSGGGAPGRRDGNRVSRVGVDRSNGPPTSFGTRATVLPGGVEDGCSGHSSVL